MTEKIKYTLKTTRTEEDKPFVHHEYEGMVFASSINREELEVFSDDDAVAGILERAHEQIFQRFKRISELNSVVIEQK
jgi:hypothetical protein